MTDLALTYVRQLKKPLNRLLESNILHLRLIICFYFFNSLSTSCEQDYLFAGRIDAKIIARAIKIDQSIPAKHMIAALPFKLFPSILK